MKLRKKQTESWKKQWESLSKEEQLLRLEGWIKAGQETRKNGEFLKPSSIEIKVKEQLDLIGIKYVQQKRINDGERNYFIDFYISSLSLVIDNRFSTTPMSHSESS